MKTAQFAVTVKTPNHYDAFAMADRIEETGQWHVRCAQCLDFIGVFTSEMLMEAIRRTAHRGGVVCPDCRELTCDSCGLTFPKEDAYRLRLEQRYGRQYRLCKLCDL